MSDLDHQHEHRERAEVVPEVEVLRRVVLRRLLLPELGHREAVVDPRRRARRGGRRRCDGGLVAAAHHAIPRVSADHDARVAHERYGGTGRLSRRRHALEDAARQVELRAVAGAEEAARPVGGRRVASPGVNLSSGAQPRCVQTPTSTRYSGLIARAAFLANAGCSDSADSGSRRRRVVVLESRDHLRRAVHDVDRLAAPLDLEHARPARAC